MQVRQMLVGGAAVATAAMLWFGTSGVAGASGNGIAGESAGQIVSAASSATKGASSFTLDGTVTEGSQTYGFDGLSMSNSGTASGAITFQGVRVNIIKTQNLVYISGNTAFWRKAGAPSGIAGLFNGKWVYGSTSNSDLASLSSVLSPQKLTSQFNVSNTNGAKKGPTTTVAGQKVITVYGRNGSTSGVIYVATTGTPYITRIRAVGRSEYALLTFTNYDQAVNPSPPQNAININSGDESNSGS